jgi:hypothetical protein
MTEPIAEFSPCRKYRYTLWRTWLEPLIAQRTIRYVNFICLNPSTADETKDDNTIRKCVKFAKRWGYDALCVTNLFAYRATKPSDMKSQIDPVGPNNDFRLVSVAKDAALVVAAWSQHGSYLARSEDVLKILPYRPHVLRMGKSEPWHPLYLPDNTTPIEWNAEP